MFHSSAVDMLRKASNDFNDLEADVNSDTIMDFFVTAYSIKDYYKAENDLSDEEVKDEFGEELFDRMRYIANKSKHKILRSSEIERRFSGGIWSGAIGGAPIGALPVNGGDLIFLFDDGRIYEIVSLAQEVLNRWEDLIED